MNVSYVLRSVLGAWVYAKCERWSIHRASLHGAQDLLGELDKPANKSKQNRLAEELNSTIAARTETIVKLDKDDYNGIKATCSRELIHLL